MALAAPMSAANGHHHDKHHHGFYRCEKCEKRAKKERKKRYKKYKKWAKRHRHHCPEREVVVMHRPPGGRYVMYAGSPHWYADDVLYRIERRGDSNCYIVVNFSL